MCAWKLTRVLCACLLCGNGVFPQASNPPVPARNAPEAAGVYYWQPQRGWIKLDHAKVEDSRTRGMGRFMDTDGLSGIDVTESYLGARATLRIADSSPVFYVRATVPFKEALQNAIIVELTPRKTSREAHISSTIAGIGNREGYKRGEVRRVLVTQLTKDSYSLRPQQELKSGEYLLVLSQADNAFDFGVEPATH